MRYWWVVTCQLLLPLYFTLYRFHLCQVIACSSLCYITISWAALLPLSAIKFVLLTLQTVLSILNNPGECTSSFLYQVSFWQIKKGMQYQSFRLITLHYGRLVPTPNFFCFKRLQIVNAWILLTKAILIIAMAIAINLGKQ